MNQILPPALHARAQMVLRRLELDVTRRLDGILHGDYAGLVPGHGSEPGEARPYQPGDDVRRIDWSVTARTNELHTRETVADRELETWLAVDRSASLSFGTADLEKSDLILAAAAGVGFLTNRGGNRIGAVIAGDQMRTVPARQGRSHLLALLAEIQRCGGTDRVATTPLAAVLKRTAAVAHRRGLVVALSDWLDEPSSWSHQLGVLAARHQVLAVEVVDPRELELPSAGILTVIDTETGAVRDIDTGSRRVRQRYAEAAEHQRREIAAAIASSGAEHLQLRTDRDWLGDLARYVMTRRRLRANVGVARR